MSDDNALVPVEQKVVYFYDDEVAAVRMDNDTIFVPIRPLVEAMGLNWSGQLQRIRRDPVLNEVSGVCVIHTPLSDSKFANPQEMICLPLEFINGWLFGINASRVKDEIRERLIRYQRECYQVLANAFLEREPAEGSAVAHLHQVREMGLAIARMAEEQIEFERRLTTSEKRIDKAAVVYGDLTKRVATLEERISPGKPVTQEQAVQISQAVKAVAFVMGKQTGRNEFGGVYSELYRKFHITDYKRLPVQKFRAAMDFLTEWYQSLTDDEVPF